MRGLPRSGKTTFAKSLIYPIVSPDDIRLSVFGERFNAANEPAVWRVLFATADALAHGEPHATRIVVDATSNTLKRILPWIEWCERNRWALLIKDMETPADECIRRAEAMGDSVIIPVIERMASERTADDTTEGIIALVERRKDERRANNFDPETGKPL